MTIRAMETNTMALIQTSSIQAIMTLPQRLSFSAQLTNCNFATCWQVEPSILSLLQLSFNIHSSNGFSCPVKFFHLKIAIGLALGESWLVLVQPQKNTDVLCLPFPISVGRLSLANLQKSLRRKQGCKHMDQI